MTKVSTSKKRRSFMMRVWQICLLLVYVVVAVPVNHVEHSPCPCDTPGAVFLELSSGAPQAPVVDMNETGLLDTNGTLDLLKSQRVNEEEDSVCVCKRHNKPKSPVRCTRGDLLNTNCNERDEMRKNGYEVAPEGQLTKLYPDEVLKPAPKADQVPAGKGKVFHDNFIEQTAVKNVAVEDETIAGYAKIGQNLQAPTQIEVDEDQFTEIKPVSHQPTPAKVVMDDTPEVVAERDADKPSEEASAKILGTDENSEVPTAPTAVENIVQPDETKVENLPATESEAKSETVPSPTIVDESAQVVPVAEYHEPTDANPIAGDADANVGTDAAYEAKDKQVESENQVVNEKPKAHASHSGGPKFMATPTAARGESGQTTVVDGAMVAKLLQQQLAEQAEVTRQLKDKLEDVEKKLQSLQGEKDHDADDELL